MIQKRLDRSGFWATGAARFCDAGLEGVGGLAGGGRRARHQLALISVGQGRMRQLGKGARTYKDASAREAATGVRAAPSTVAAPG